LVTDPYQTFRQAVDRPEEKIDLGRAALTIALSDYPRLDIAAYLARIDQIAVDVVHRCEAGGDVLQSVAALNYVLFSQHGFHGNRDDYYDPKNSFLNEVIERKTGIPITLSILYMEVAQRIGLALDGVGFPGHFLVKCAKEGGEIVIDPFDRGEIKSREELRLMLERLYGRAIALRPEFFKPASKRDILKRMLGNLKAIYLKSNDLVKLLAVLDRAIILEPAGAEEIRDRGTVYLRLECYPQARADFETYLCLAPQADDAAAVREQLVSLAQRVTLIH
jgi:regulator of sirC expression with transglutaminase-like and TPR domain